MVMTLTAPLRARYMIWEVLQATDSQHMDGDVEAGLTHQSMWTATQAAQLRCTQDETAESQLLPPASKKALHGLKEATKRLGACKVPGVDLPRLHDNAYL